MCAVAGFVSEAIGTMVIQFRRIGKASIRVELQGAVGRTLFQNRSKNWAVRIGVVGKHARGFNGEGNIFVSRISVIHSHRINRDIVNRNGYISTDLDSNISDTDLEGVIIGAHIHARCPGKDACHGVNNCTIWRIFQTKGQGLKWKVRIYSSRCES